MKQATYVEAERNRANEWKNATVTLPDAARGAAPWVNHDGVGIGRYPHCLPRDYAHLNLLPESRQGSIELFAELGIPWHCGVAGGPGNNLLSSQVQCVNALYPMVTEPTRIISAFGGVLDIAEVLQIEPERFLTFEYIGPDNYFGEADGRTRVRGSGCTSVDAAFKYRTSEGEVELALVEWKYTESYAKRRSPDPKKDVVRSHRYLVDFDAEDSPLWSDRVPFTEMLDEPFYQLMRQQLLAHRLELAHAEGADRVRVVHVLSPSNRAYQEPLTRDEHRAIGQTVGQVWQALLRTPDRFCHLDAEVFLDQDITSRDYVNRYGMPRSEQEFIDESWERLSIRWTERFAQMTWNDSTSADVIGPDGLADGMPWLSVRHDAGWLVARTTRNGLPGPERVANTSQDEEVMLRLGWEADEEGGYRHVTHPEDATLPALCIATLSEVYRVVDPHRLLLGDVIGASLIADLGPH